MKVILFAIADYGKTPYRPTLFCKQTRPTIQDNVVVAPGRTATVTFDQSGISRAINENDPDLAEIMAAMEKVYKPKYNTVKGKPVIVGPFEGESYNEAVNKARKAQLELRERTPEEKAAIAEAKAAKAEGELASHKAEIDDLKAKLEKATKK
jgi:hypothetical protein